MNNDKVSLPGLGNIVLNANPGESWSAFGYWDIGADDTIRVTLFDAQDNTVIEITSQEDLRRWLN